MVKTQVYLPEGELRALHEVAKREKRPVAALVREAIRRVWLKGKPKGPVALWNGPWRGSSADHESAFDEP
jgi:hypothetical protein